MQKIIVMTLFILSFNTFAESMAERHNILYVESLNHLNNREYKDGIVALESIFKETKDDKLKAEVAYLLVITKYDTRKGMRSNYGKYAYKHYHAIPHSKRMDLARLTGDLFFQEGELDQAYFHYKEIFNNEKAPFDFREYAIYKSGWVLVNQENYEEIFKIWPKWLRKFNKGDLYENILHDYAKFYYEYNAIKKSRSIPLSFSVSKTDKRYPKFMEGFLNGFKRYMMKSPIEPLRELKGQPFYTTLLNSVLKDSFYFSKKPCKALPFIQSADLKSLNMATAMDTANLCFTEFRPYILGHKRGVKAVINDAKANLSLTYPLLQTKGVRNFIQGEFLYVIKDYPKACKSFVRGLVSQKLKKVSKKKLSKALNAMGVTCQKSDTKLIAEDLKQFYAKYYSSKEFISLYKKNKQIKTTFNNIILLPGHINIMGSIFVTNAKKWKGQDLISFMLKKSFDNKQNLYNIFYSLNPDIVQSNYKDVFASAIHELIENKKYEEAFKHLNHFVPLSSANSDFAQIWFLLSDTKISSYKGFPKKYEISSRFNELTHSNKLSKDDKKFLAIYLIKEGKIDSLLENWNNFKKHIHKDKVLSEQFVQSLVKRGKWNSPGKASSDSLYRLAKNMGSIQKTKSQLRSKLFIPSSFRKTPLGKDWNAIARTHNFSLEISSIKKKKSSSSLIMRYLKKSQSTYNRFTSHKWTSEENYNLSKVYLVKSLGQFISYVKAQKAASSEEAQQYQQLTQILTDWKESV